MSSVWRARAVQLGAAGLVAVAVVLVGRWLGGGFERAYGLRAAASAAAYLALVSPAARADRQRYDLPQLIAQARALATLPDWRDTVEVYYGSIPLLRATAPPLAPTLVGRLDTAGAPLWQDGAAFAALRGPRAAGIVGVVRLVPRGIRPGWVWLGPGLVAFLIAMIVVAGGLARRPVAVAAAGALLLGAAACAELRGTALAASNRWLLGARLLIQEAAARPFGPRLDSAALARLAPDAEVVRATREIVRPRRRTVDGRRLAVVTARLGRGRLLELRTAPAEEGLATWFAAILGLALLAPLGVWLLRPRSSLPAPPYYGGERSGENVRRSMGTMFALLAALATPLAPDLRAPGLAAQWSATVGLAATLGSDWQIEGVDVGAGRVTRAGPVRHASLALRLGTFVTDAVVFGGSRGFAAGLALAGRSGVVPVAEVGTDPDIARVGLDLTVEVTGYVADDSPLVQGAAWAAVAVLPGLRVGNPGTTQFSLMLGPAVFLDRGVRGNVRAFLGLRVDTPLARRERQP